jgi:hypothetical protein
MRHETRSFLSGGGRSGQRGKVWVGIALVLALPVALALPGVTSSILPGAAPVSAAATSPGSLRVVSSPAVPTQMLVDGQIADSWGLTWLSLAPGTHTVSFTHVPGYTEPAPQTVTITSGATTTVTGTFVPRGYLRVMTSPAVASEITVDGNPADDSGVWTDLPTGSHKVCFGAVVGYDPPPCQTATLTAGNTTTITGTFTADSTATGQTGMGLLRVTTNPALPSQITLTPQGGTTTIADSWALNWLQLAPGTYTVGFSHVPGYTEPAAQTVTITAGATSTVTGTFVTRGTLRVTTSPAVDATVSIDGNPADNWGVWTDLPTGAHQICFGTLANYTTPACQTATITASNETDITGTYVGGTTPPGGCGLASAAFCDNFSEGPSQGGRGGDLNPAVWSVSRDVGGLDATDLMAFPSTPVSSCKSGVTTVSPDDDVLVCDGSSGRQGQILTALSAQNYAFLSMRPRQPFDFAGRTGTISYNVDAVTDGGLSWWTSLWVTDQPSAGATNAAQVLGVLPDNGVGVNFDNDCGDPSTEVGVGGVFTYSNYAETYIANPSVTCVPTQRGSLNHIQVQLSQTNIAVYASAPSTNGGQTFPANQLLFSTPISLNFTRGYVHFQENERAPLKYTNEFGITPTYANNYWSDLAFDGPVINSGEVGYSVPDALTTDPSNGADNVGYGLLVNPTSTYTCCSGANQTTIGPFSISKVSVAGVTSAELTFDVSYTYAFSLTTSNVALQFKINGGPWQNPNPAPNYTAEYACTNCPGPNGGGGVPYTVTVPVNDLVSGTNTIAFQAANSPNSYPPVLTSLDLLTFTG